MRISDWSSDVCSSDLTSSPRVAAGLGTIARVVANGASIYRRKLSLEEGLQRIRSYYWPYHEALRSLVAETKGRFGYCILIDCHSMPSNRTEARRGGKECVRQC